MKRKLTSVYAIFWALLTACLFSSWFFNPPPGNYTGSPGANTCSSSAGGCHSCGTCGTGTVSIAGLPATISPNTSYSITVTVTRTSTIPLLGGFQMVALDGNNANVGELSDPGASSTLDDSAVPGFVFFEHEPAQTMPGGNPSSVIYTVTWTSPASATNPIKMYAAANLANDNNGTDGDRITLTNVQGNLTGGPITVNVTGVNVSCFDGDDGSATANPSGGGGPPYFYEWSNGGSTQTIDNLFAGNYQVTVTNSAGGMGTGSVTITQPQSEVAVSISSQTIITCANPTGSATAAASGGTPGYSFAWSSGASGATASNLAAGIHFVTATDANDCTAVTSVNITSNTTPPTASITPGGATEFCTGGSVTLTASGGTSYSWSTGAMTAAINASTTGNYVVTVTGSNGCTATASQAVTAHPLPTASITPGGATTFCEGGSVTLTASGGTSFSWSNGATTAAINVSISGNYTVVVTDANGCTDSESQSVTAHPLPTASISGANSICAGTTATLTASGGTSYLWNTGATTASIQISAAGTYSVVATDANSCTDDASHVVSATDPLACDDDGDTFTENDGDCNDANAAIFPGATEICNGVNEDCDGTTDEGICCIAAPNVLYFNNFESQNWGIFEEIVGGNACYEDGIGQVALSAEQVYLGTSSLRVWANQAGSTFSNHVIGQFHYCSDGLTEQYRYRTYFYLPSSPDPGQTGPEFSVQSTRNVSGTNLTYIAGIQYVNNPWVTDKWNIWHNGTWVDIDPAGFNLALAPNVWYLLELDFDLATNAYFSLHVEGNGVDVSLPLNQPFANAPNGYLIAGENRGFSPATWLTLESENLWTNCAEVRTLKMFYDNVELIDISACAPEICDGVDNDCDGDIDEGVLSTFFQDADDDDFGNANLSQQACSAPPGYVANDDDCNDANSAINPAASELCNGVDDDCNGSPEAATNTWTGNGDGMNWSQAANWSDGIVPLACQDVVIPTGKSATVPAGFQALGKTLEVVLGAILQVDLTGLLTIQN